MENTSTGHGTQIVGQVHLWLGLLLWIAEHCPCLWSNWNIVEGLGLLLDDGESKPSPNIDANTCASIYLSPRNEHANILWSVPMMPDSFPDVLYTHRSTSCSWQLSPIMGPLHMSILLTGGPEFKCGPSALKSGVLSQSIPQLLRRHRMTGCHF